MRKTFKTRKENAKGKINKNREKDERKVKKKTEVIEKQEEN